LAATANPLIEAVGNHLAGSRPDLPPFHPLALRLQEMLREDDYDIDDVVGLISNDQALAGEILKVANSPLFCGLNKVATIQDATIRLGSREVTNLVMLTTQQKNYRARHPLVAGQMYRLWKHAMSCAAGARLLAGMSGHWELEQEAFMGGLFHDIGKLLVLRACDEVLAASPELEVSPQQIVEIADELHVEQGSLLMAQWNMPEPYQAVVREHHLEEFDSRNRTLLAVRLANLLCRKLGVGMHREPLLDPSISEEALSLGVQQNDLDALESKIEDAMSMVA